MVSLATTSEIKSVFLMVSSLTGESRNDERKSNRCFLRYPFWLVSFATTSEIKSVFLMVSILTGESRNDERNQIGVSYGIYFDRWVCGSGCRILLVKIEVSHLLPSTRQAINSPVPSTTNLPLATKCEHVVRRACTRSETYIHRRVCWQIDAAVNIAVTRDWWQFKMRLVTDRRDS